MDGNRTACGVAVELYGPRSSVAIVSPAGELDTVTAPGLRAELITQIECRSHVILDLSQLTYLGSAGLKVIVEAHHAAQERGGVLRITGTGRRIVARSLSVTGLDALLVISGEPAAGLAAALTTEPAEPAAGD